MDEARVISLPKARSREIVESKWLPWKECDMETSLIWEKLVEHFLLSASAVLLGATLAWPTSGWISRELERRVTQESRSQKLVILFPWRAIVVSLFVLFVLSARTRFLLELGMLRVVLSLSAASLVLGAALFTRAPYKQAKPATSSERKLASVRTLATAVAALAVPGYKYSTFGASLQIGLGLEFPGRGYVWAGIVMVAAVALIFDLILGYFEYRSS